MTHVTEMEDEDRSKVGTPEPGTSRRRRGVNANQQNAIGKIRHLKKEDGEPLWRADIQYDFLRGVFDNKEAVFTNSWEPNKPKQNFADLYIDTMSRSSKTSKVLRDKLLSDREAAKNMAMVCLLVNIGRMNTTLNCTFFITCLLSLFALLIQCLAQSFPRCEHSYEHTMPSLRYRPDRIPIRISSCKTPLD